MNVSIFNYFRSRDKGSASIAKERLQIVVAHERKQRNQPDFIPQLKRDILDVIAKYVQVDQEDISVSLDKSDNCSILELNVTLPSA